MSTAEKLPAERLPVPVREYPHWRVTYRPATYIENRIPTLLECAEIVSKNRVTLRGWDYPHVPAPDQLEFGSRWIASSSDFRHHFEYWRFYQSTQFLYLGRIREVSTSSWNEELQTMKVFNRAQDMNNVDGWISITDVVYSITEIFEFAARLAQAHVYTEPTEIAINLTGIRNFALTGAGTHAYTASEPMLPYKRSLTPADLVSASAEAAVNCTVWFFERFGWLSPNVEFIRADQKKLLAGCL